MTKIEVEGLKNNLGLDDKQEKGDRLKRLGVSNQCDWRSSKCLSTANG